MTRVLAAALLSVLTIAAAGHASAATQVTAAPANSVGTASTTSVTAPVTHEATTTTHDAAKTVVKKKEKAADAVMTPSTASTGKATSDKPAIAKPAVKPAS